MAVEHATTGTELPQRENTDYNTDKVNAILPAVLAYCTVLPQHSLQPASHWAKLLIGGRHLLRGVLQSCEAITKTLTSISEGNKQGGKRCVFGKAGPLAQELQVYR